MDFNFPPREALLRLLFHADPQQVALGLSLLEGFMPEEGGTLAQAQAFLAWIGADLWFLAYARYDRDYPHKMRCQLLLCQASPKYEHLVHDPLLFQHRAANNLQHLEQIRYSLGHFGQDLEALVVAQYLCGLSLPYWAEGWPLLLEMLHEQGVLFEAPLPNPQKIWQRYGNLKLDASELNQALAYCIFLNIEEKAALAEYWLAKSI